MAHNIPPVVRTVDSWHGVKPPTCRNFLTLDVEPLADVRHLCNVGKCLTTLGYDRVVCSNTLTDYEPVRQSQRLGFNFARLLDLTTFDARPVVTYLIYRYIEVPVRRLARKIAFSGQWKY